MSPPVVAASRGDDVAPGELRLTVDELAATTGVPTRTLRFWANRRLLAPPHLRGRTGLYDERHVATVSLIRDLQAGGFTLTAVEAVLGRLPDDPTADDIALFGSLATPWQVEGVTDLSHTELEAAVGHPIPPEHLDRLEAGGVLDRVGPDTFRVPNRLRDRFLQLGELGAPEALLVEAIRPVERAAHDLAAELTAIFDRHLRAGGTPRDAAERERVRALADALRGTTVDLLTTAFQRAVARVMADGAAVDLREP